MDRKEKVEMFFAKTGYRAKWCIAKTCACSGCINRARYQKDEWVKMFPGEPLITKEEVDSYNAKN